MGAKLFWNIELLILFDRKGGICNNVKQFIFREIQLNSAKPVSNEKNTWRSKGKI